MIRFLTDIIKKVLINLITIAIVLGALYFFLFRPLMNSIL